MLLLYICRITYAISIIFHFRFGIFKVARSGMKLKQTWTRFVSDSVSLSRTPLARFDKGVIFFSSFCDLMPNIYSAMSSSSEYSCDLDSSTIHWNYFFGDLTTYRPEEPENSDLPAILQSIDLFEKRMILCDDRKEWQDQSKMFWTWTTVSVLFQ